MSAQFVAILSAIMATIACAGSAFAWWKSSELARGMRSTSSALAELLEIRDYMAKLDAWSKRINGRLVNQERRSTESQRQSTDSAMPSAMLTKDDLRRRAGMIAGKPAPHRE